jgi:hypothetical protein
MQSQYKLQKEILRKLNILFNRKDTNHLPKIISIVAKVSITLNVENKVNKKHMHF